MTIPTGDQKDRREILRTLEGDGPFFITSHRNPDGDAVGSLLALSMWLTGRGKDARAACADPVPSQYQFLPGIDRVGLGLPDTLRGAVGIVVDSPDAARVAEDPSVLSSADVLVNVDHHVGNSRYGDLNLVDPTASSTALILHEMLSDLGGPPSREVASALYVGVLTDTGAFRFSNTDARTFAAAAELTRLGADAAGVARGVYGEQPVGRLKLTGLVLASVEPALGGRVSVMYLTEAMRRESGCSGEDIEGLASHGRLIKGVDVALVLREEGDSVRVSLRSKGVVDVNLVAESLGGGGHRSAAGASVPGTLATVRERVLAVLSEQLR